jgi:AcrR family transcriptional regulator
MYEMSSETEDRAAELTREAEERAAEKVQRAEEKAERAAERAREAGARAERQAEKAAERAERAGEKAAERAAKVGRAAEADDATLVWFREEPAARRPAHTRADIARAAVEIADSEGFEAVSMRRVAQRLGAGTMTLYHYVRNKDELITLMSDLVMGEVVVPEGELADGWRAALTQIAGRTRDAFSAHHWIFERMGDGRPGPNGMRHFEQSLRAVSSLGLDREQIFELIGQIDDYVFGYALREVQEQEEHERGWPPEVIDFFQRELDSGRYPLLSEFFGDDAQGAIEEAMDWINVEGRFERGLSRLLDGIESSLPRS